MSYDAGRILIMPKGAWSDSTTYEILDVVTYNRGSYLSKVSNNTGHTPTGNNETDDYWFLFAHNGNGITSIEKTSSTVINDRVVDTYTIHYTDSADSTYTVVNGKDGTGFGDMEKAVYDANDDGVADVALSELTDAVIASPSNNQFLRYDSVAGKWKNMSAGDINGYFVEKTLQEYEALTPEQKMDELIYYAITDISGDYDTTREIVAPTESETAIGTYNEGDEFILGDYLYKAISAIAQGDPIVTSGTGQNAALAGTIVDQLKQLFDGETVLKRTQDGTSITNIDFAYNSNGIRYYLVFASSQTPDTGTYHLIDLTISSYYSLQFIMSVAGTAIYMRHRAGSAWDTAWKQIYGVSGAQTITPIHANISTGSSTSLVVRKSGNVVQFYGTLYATADIEHESTTLFTIPEGFRPTSNLMIPVLGSLYHATTDFKEIVFEITASTGNVVLSNISPTLKSLNYYRFCITWLTNQ